MGVFALSIPKKLNNLLPMLDYIFKSYCIKFCKKNPRTVGIHYVSIVVWLKIWLRLHFHSLTCR